MGQSSPIVSIINEGQMFYHLTLVSSNKKVGPIPVSTVSAQTCPTSCPLNNHQGCYADTGPLAIHWKKVTSGQRGMSFDDFTKAIANLPAKQLWRHAQAGDLPGEGDKIDAVQLRKLADANGGKPAIVYTHKPPKGNNLKALRAAAAVGFSINLSADSFEEADEFADLNLPVVLTLPEQYGRGKKEDINQYRERLESLPTRTEKGRPIAVCPATWMETDCSQCKLCSRAERNEIIVGFPAHGSRKGKITNADRLADFRNSRSTG